MKKFISIYFINDSELLEIKSKKEGWRENVLIKIDSNYIKLTFASYKGMIKKYNSSKSKNKVYLFYNQIIMLPNVTKKNIINGIKKMDIASLMYLKPIDLTEEYKDINPKLCDINNWEKVY